jgi:branched-chain amino acid transport system permease protein
MLAYIILTTLINGSTYALLAIGFSLIFGVARIVNIAHTAFYMVAAYCIFYGTHRLGAHPIFAVLIAIILVMVLGLICYQLFIEPIREHEAAVLIATIALAMVFQEIVMLIFTGDFRTVPPLVSGYIEFAGLKIAYQQLLSIAAAGVILAAVWTFLAKTRLGLAIRATAQDREVANLMGMNEARVAMLTLVISVALAALTGAAVLPMMVLNPHMWMAPLIMMMAVVVLGGLGSLKGSFAGAYILAFSEALVVFLIPKGAFLRESVALSIMILVLLLRPEGLFGISFEEER